MYEYFEQLCCFTPPQFTYTESENYRIGYDKLGIEWSNPILNGKPKYWINGCTTFSHKNIEIPYNFVFYGKPLNDIAKHLGSSNGVALGKINTDAFQRALREYIERDVLLTCWLDKGKDLFHVKINHHMGISHYLSKQGINIDCFVYKYKICNNFIVWCQLTNSKNKQAYHSSGFSAKPNIEKAVSHALSEAWGALKYKEENILSKSSSPLKDIQDYYFDIRNTNKVKVLTKYTKSCNYSNLINLSNITLRSKYQEIISVDLSIPELRNQGLYCKKVIGIGGKSMVFDYHLAPDMPKYLPLA
ncbi:YcaO-like family protein [Lactobacillus helveticus]|nr:YcaO-like family protein [Lactobacillus helveticus]